MKWIEEWINVLGVRIKNLPEKFKDISLMLHISTQPTDKPSQWSTNAPNQWTAVWIILRSIFHSGLICQLHLCNGLLKTPHPGIYRDWPTGNQVSGYLEGLTWPTKNQMSVHPNRQKSQTETWPLRTRNLSICMLANRQTENWVGCSGWLTENHVSARLHGL